jgi:hypothetical protein
MSLYKDRLDFSFFFGLMPLEAVNRFVFGNSKYSAEDVIARLEVKYCGEEILRETQKMLIEEVLKPILRDWANEDCGNGNTLLSRFVKFCTGKSYLPHPSQTKTKIMVEFEGEELLSKDAFPKAHTCENMLGLPEQAYDANRETFESKLRESVKYCDVYSMH